MNGRHLLTCHPPTSVAPSASALEYFKGAVASLPDATSHVVMPRGGSSSAASAGYGRRTSGGRAPPPAPPPPSQSDVGMQFPSGSLAGSTAGSMSRSVAGYDSGGREGDGPQSWGNAPLPIQSSSWAAPQPPHSRRSTLETVEEVAVFTASSGYPSPPQPWQHPPPSRWPNGSSTNAGAIGPMYARLATSSAPGGGGRGGVARPSLAGSVAAELTQALLSRCEYRKGTAS